jgi:hypothetical protein
LDPAAFVGRPVDGVETQLEEAGLVVRREAAGDDLIQSVDEQLEPGDVAGLEPSGTFAPPGTSVTLYVVPRDARPEATQESSETTSAAPTTSTGPTQTSPPSGSPTDSSSAAPSSATESSVLPGSSEPPPSTDPPAGEEADPGAAGPDEAQ